MMDMQLKRRRISLAISKKVGKAAGQLAVLFSERPSNYDQDKLQSEIREILRKNKVVR